MGATMRNEADPFRTLYDANYQRFRGLLARMAGPQEAEDLAQAVFAKAAKALPTFRNEAQTSTWLYRIAVNVASDWLRSRSTHEAKVTVPLPDAPDEDMRAAATGADVNGQPTPEQELARKELMHPPGGGGPVHVGGWVTLASPSKLRDGRWPQPPCLLVAAESNLTLLAR